jgi:hypothetical protein
MTAGALDAAPSSGPAGTHACGVGLALQSMGTGLCRLGIATEIEGSLIVQPPGRRGSKYHCGHGMRTMLRALSRPCAGLAGFVRGGSKTFTPELYRSGGGDAELPTETRPTTAREPAQAPTREHVAKPSGLSCA